MLSLSDIIIYGSVTLCIEHFPKIEISNSAYSVGNWARNLQNTENTNVLLYRVYSTYWTLTEKKIC